jgi:hypothetical protein
LFVTCFGFCAVAFCFGLLLRNQLRHACGRICVLLELISFFVGQLTPLSGSQIAELNGAFAYAQQANDVESEGFRYAANLAFASFTEDNAYPRATLAAFDDVDPGWGGHDSWFFAVRTIEVVLVAGFIVDGRELDAGAPFAQIVGARRIVEQGVVFFFDLIAGMCQCLCHGAIVSEEHEPFAGEVEPAHQVEALGHVDQIGDGGTTLRVIGGRNNSDRFVEHHVRARLTCAERLTVNHNGVDIRVDTSSGDLHDLTIHGNSALINQDFTITARGYA